MKKIISFLSLLFLITGIAHATLTNGNLISVKNAATNPPTTQNSPVSTDGTNVNVTTLQGNCTINGTTGALSCPGTLSSTGPLGAIQFPVLSGTPASNPPSGYLYMYTKSDGNPYVLSHAGVETEIAIIGGGGVNWASVSGVIGNQQINWANINMIGSLNINWTNVNLLAKLNMSGINWSDAQNLTGSVNWSNVNLIAKSLTPMEETIATATSITPNGLITVTYMNNSQTAGTFTVNNPTNTPNEGQSWELKITSTNVQSFSWGTKYHGGTTALPTGTTGGGKTDCYTFQWDSVNSRFNYTGLAAGF